MFLSRLHILVLKLEPPLCECWIPIQNFTMRGGHFAEAIFLGLAYKILMASILLLKPRWVWHWIKDVFSGIWHTEYSSCLPLNWNILARGKGVVHGTQAAKRWEDSSPKVEEQKQLLLSSLESLRSMATLPATCAGESSEAASVRCHPCSCKQPLLPAPEVTPVNSLEHQARLGCAVSLACCQYPIWDAHMCVHTSLGKSPTHSKSSIDENFEFQWRVITYTQPCACVLNELNIFFNPSCCVIRKSG